MAYDSYNSQYPSAYYEIGTVYAFYSAGEESGIVTPATEDQIKRFAKSIDASVAESKKQMSENGTWMKFIRVMGVVIDKTETTITTMFKTDDGEYILKKYIVSNGDVFFNDKELVKPSGVMGKFVPRAAEKIATGIDVVNGTGTDALLNQGESSGIDIVKGTGIDAMK